ncbi:NBR1-Ig-like domain-containing protein [Kribbella sancticallisti]|uniref:NBR1-Ig-like domain-containing protein n=1 Tax=Kribbella sancticallisti TaxID=460087 RepID=UPI0031D71EEC
MSPRYLLQLERGEHSNRDVNSLPHWLKVLEVDRIRANASRVPAWLVRAYDVAFGADGFLADVYTWSEALQEDQLRDLPRRVRDRPIEVMPGDEYAYLTRDLGEPGDSLRRLLLTQASELAGQRDRFRAAPRMWAPVTGDKTGFLGEAEDEAPEGTIAAPGSMLVARFVIHNIGQVRWRDRLMYRVGSASVGMASSPCVPLPDTDPGSTADVRCVLRAPTAPGTYRACFKMGWMDGTYCFPTTLLGVLFTVIVPPADIADPYQDWPDHD